MLSRRICELFAALVTATEVFSYSFLPPSIQWIFMLASILLFIAICVLTRGIRRINPILIIAADSFLKIPVLGAVFKILFTIISYRNLYRPLHWNDYECAKHYGRYQCTLYGRSLLLLWMGLIDSALCFLFDPPVLLYLWAMRKTGANYSSSRDAAGNDYSYYNSTYRDFSQHYPSIAADSNRVTYPTAAAVEPVTTVTSSLPYQYVHQGYQSSYGYPTPANPPPPYSP
ncbi:hypothetical protein OESDEN_02753 [Oesophagostomum dentatum]|uniref:Uncharacterized protein n=1 Tax=Oesophagostomum dentatum TaxID=61180 RepID=A0A0B1TI96_OESDE|nr:hypothetical protein OESDEN_02753 [Oesophagostomum dentatum]